MIAQLDGLYWRTRPWKLWSRLLAYVFFEGRPVTTRGRWINPVVFGHFAVERRLPQLRSVRRPAFILGTGRSGTTVLGMVLSMHREVGFLNEPKALWHAIYPDEDLLGSYSLGQARYRLAAEHSSTDVARNAHRLFGAYLATSFSRRLVDKYPELIFRVPFVRAIFPDARFILLVRNGWDTIQSIDEWQSWIRRDGGAVKDDWWGVNRRKWSLLVEQLVPEHADLAPHSRVMIGWNSQTAMAAVEWIVAMREGLALLDRQPEVILRVNYEQLCREPRKTLDEIARFLDLSSDDEAYFAYGAQTLKSAEIRTPCQIPDEVVAPFNQVMQRLGYPA